MYNNLLSLSPEQFYKIEFFPFRSPQIFTILKEGDGDNLGFQIFTILKERVTLLNV